MLPSRWSSRYFINFNYCLVIVELMGRVSSGALFQITRVLMECGAMEVIRSFLCVIFAIDLFGEGEGLAGLK